MKPLTKNEKLYVSRHALERIAERFGMAQQDAINYMTKYLKGMALPVKINPDPNAKRPEYVVTMPNGVRLVMCKNEKSYVVLTALHKEQVKIKLIKHGNIRFGNIYFNAKPGGGE